MLCVATLLRTVVVLVNPVGAKMSKKWWLVLMAMPSVAFAHTPWESVVAYSGVIGLPILISIFIAGRGNRLKWAIIGAIVLAVCGYLVSLELTLAPFIVVTAVPYGLIPVSIMCKKGKGDKENGAGTEGIKNDQPKINRSSRSRGQST